MNLVSFLRKAIVRLENKNENDFKLPVAVQKKYLEHFKDPTDDFERSYFQYRCQMRFYNALLRFIINCASLPLLLYYRFRHRDSVPTDNKEAIFFADGKPDSIIPDELREKFGEIQTINEKKESLTKDDRIFFIALLKKYPLSWHFLLKCLIKIRFYSYAIQKSNPKCIIVCNEYSFTSSVMTKYCENKEITHFNVMHGEKYYYIRDSFFRFHNCYVWDEYYKDLFISLRTEPKQFIIAIPPFIRIESANWNKTIDYTYYLGNETGETLRKIIGVLINLKKKGSSVALRPHPRYSNMDEVRDLAEEIEIEDGEEISIEESICRTSNAISLCSTVLYQAFNAGVGIVIDDFSNPTKFKNLEDLGYIMLKKEHKLLSQSN